MSKPFYTYLLFAVVCIALYSCSTGDYIASPSSPANQSVNPLNPLKANEFTWGGSKPFSANINGAPWVADTAYIYVDTSGSGNIMAMKGKSILFIHYPDSWTGLLYNMGWQQSRFAFYTDSIGPVTSTYSGYYYSNLGNSGELNIIKSAHDTLIAKFYFQGINSNGGLINVSNGYIDCEY